MVIKYTMGPPGYNNGVVLLMRSWDLTKINSLLVKPKHFKGEIFRG